MISGGGGGGGGVIFFVKVVVIFVISSKRSRKAVGFSDLRLVYEVLLYSTALAFESGNSNHSDGRSLSLNCRLSSYWS